MKISKRSNGKGFDIDFNNSTISLRIGKNLGFSLSKNCDRVALKMGILFIGIYGY